MQKQSKVVINHSLNILRAMTPGELDALAIAAANTVAEAKQSADFSKASNPSTGKVICVLEERLNKAKSDRTIASNTSLASYWNGITKSKMPNHAMTCAVCFGTWVRTELLPEKDYDLCSANIIELAGAISNAVNGDLLHEAIAKVTLILKERDMKNATKQLREILKSVKPTKPMDAETAQEMLKKIFADGHLKLVLAESAAEMCYLDGNEAKESYFALVAAGTLVDKHFGAQTDAWLSERAPTTPEMQAAADAAKAALEAEQAAQLQAA